MVLYVYRKKKTSKNAVIINRLSRLSILIGLLLMFWALYPVISFEVYSKLFIKRDILTSVPQEKTQKSETQSDFILGQSVAKSNNLRDYTKASEWFPESNVDVSVSNLNVKEYVLSIPKLNINKAKVIVGEEDLKKSLVHFLPTSLPGENGNVVIFGHSTLPQLYDTNDYKTIFTYLPSLNEGDVIYINIGNENFEYRVSEIFVVKPDKVSVLNQDFEDSYLTLITCVPPGTYWNRLVVKSRLVGSLDKL
ncbi:MAG: class D sortase [bacterium]